MSTFRVGNRCRARLASRLFLPTVVAKRLQFSKYLQQRPESEVDGCDADDTVYRKEQGIDAWEGVICQKAIAVLQWCSWTDFLPPQLFRPVLDIQSLTVAKNNLKA